RAGRAQRRPGMAAQRFPEAAGHRHHPHRAADRPRRPRPRHHQPTRREMDRRATEGALLIELGGRLVEYRFARRRRRTLGITVDAQGLRVAAPLRAPWREIEGFLREKERWILRKLDEWS